MNRIGHLTKSSVLHLLKPFTLPEGTITNNFELCTIMEVSTSVCAPVSAQSSEMRKQYVSVKPGLNQ